MHTFFLRWLARGHWAALLGLVSTSPTLADDFVLPASYQQLAGDMHRIPARLLDAQPSDPFRRAIAGTFNDDADVDVFVQRGPHAQLLVNPALFDAALSLPASVTAIARMPGTAANGRDELATTGPAGLRLWTRDSDAGVFTSRAAGDDALWADAPSITVADLDGAFGPDVVGVSASGTQAFILLAQASGFASEVVIPLAQPALAIAVCDFTGQEPQVVVLAAGSLTIYGMDGGLRYSQSLIGGSDLTVFCRNGTAKESLAWTTPAANGSQLWLFDSSFLSSPVELTGVDVVSLAAADFDGDQDDDLVVNHEQSWDLLVIENDSGQFDFAQGSFISVGPIEFFGTPAGNEAIPAVADLDGDGDQDLLMPVQEDEHVDLFLNGRVDHASWAPPLADEEDELPVSLNYGVPNGESEPIYAYLQIHLEDAPSVAALGTHLEVLMYRKDDLETPTTLKPMFLGREPLGGPYPPQLATLIDPDPSAFFWIQRYVQLDAFGDVVRTFPAKIYALSTETSQQGPVLSWLYDRGATFHSPTAPDLTFTYPAGIEELSRSTGTIVEVVPVPGGGDDEEPGDGSGGSGGGSGE